jgi:hypothetical protein
MPPNGVVLAIQDKASRGRGHTKCVDIYIRIISCCYYPCCCSFSPHISWMDISVLAQKKGFFKKEKKGRQDF